MPTDPPNLFIVAGMPRTATTYLFQRFQEHPGIFCPYRKETSFFAGNYGRGLAWYHGLYADMPQGQIGADVSPSYFLEPRAIDRIRRHAPDSRVILGVRKPSDWALSWFAQVRSHRWSGELDLEAFLTGYRVRIGRGEVRQDLRDGYVADMVSRYQEAFGDALLIYSHEALRHEPLRVLHAIEDFLGLQRHFTPSNLQTNIVNAANRRNVGLITYLASREGFVDTVGRLLPRRLVHAGRNLFFGFGKASGRPAAATFTEEQRALVGNFFADEDRIFEERFCGKTVDCGTAR